MTPTALEQALIENADEPDASVLASALAGKSLSTTTDLAGAIRTALPHRSAELVEKAIRRVFQAVRISVNEEFSALDALLRSLPCCLNAGGRVAIMTFHSGEDRIVKNFMRERATEWHDRPEWPAPRRNPGHIFRLLTTRPIVASADEQKDNPRARSAKLRVAERLPHAC
jgi:16S rRNA (cytosine1402-N4)-methyltransferase